MLGAVFTRVIAQLKSTSPYSQSKACFEPKLDGENSPDYEERVWMHRAHRDKDGQTFIPLTQFHQSLLDSAKYLGLSVPGKGKNLYTKHFETGVRITNGLKLPYRMTDIERYKETLFVPSDGRHGGSKRVVKHFPTFPEWEGIVEFHVLDNVITKEIFQQVLVNSGRLIGIGRFRPKNRGFYGCFLVHDFQWIEGTRA